MNAPARLRERPEDFIVEELAHVEPDESGDHLLLQVEAVGLDHWGMVERLAAAHGADRRDVGWAGMKDRNAVTRQWVSIRTSRPAAQIDDDTLRVVQATRSSRRRRLGQLMGNRFRITLRGVEPSELLRAMPLLKQMAATGLPNRFGPQRFGHRGINPILGRSLLKGDFEGLLNAWLGQEGPPWPRLEDERRRCFDQGRWEQAAALWPPRWKPECSALKALAKHGRTEDAVRTVPLRIRRLWVDALQAEIFNAVLDRREAQGQLDSIGEDDIVAVFDDFHELLGDDVGPFRSPTGALPGRRMRAPGPGVADLEAAVLAEAGLDQRDFGGGEHAPGGARRPLIVPVLRASAESGVDDRGGFVRFDFALPKGSYATTALALLGYGDAITASRGGGS